MAFPSTFSTFPRPSTTSRLDNPSHSALHNQVSSALGQVEAVIGTSDSVIGTIIGDLRNPSSDGGGHVQTANKGGTGQTSYTKGDILVAQSTSVLTKLAVSSTTGQVLTANPNTAVGVEWANPAGATRIAVNSSSVATGAGAASVAVVLYSTSILGSTLSTSNAVKFTGTIRKFTTDGNTQWTVNYGNNVIASINTIPVTGSASIVAGTVEGVIAAHGSSSVQVGYLKVDLGTNATANGAASGAISYGFSYGNASVNSNADQNLTISANFSNGIASNSILSGLFIVEKIV